MPHAPLITVNVGNPGWEPRLRQAIDSNNFLKVIVKGAKASQLENELRRKGIYLRQGAIIIVAGAVLVACGIAVGLMALSAIILIAMQRGYNSISINYRDRTGQNNDELIVEMK